MLKRLDDILKRYQYLSAQLADPETIADMGAWQKYSKEQADLKDAAEKYADYIGNRSKGIFLIMQILPFFPDDVLCIIAGITAMNFPYFAGVIVLVRPLIIAAYCFLGNGSIIPFSGWGIPVWLAIIAVFATLAVLSFKYQKRFEDWLFSKFSRKKGKLKKEEKAQETIETEE